MASSPNFVNTPNVSATRFQNADGTTAKTVFTPGSNGSRVHAIFATGDETTDRQITIALKQSSVSYVIDRFTLASGTTSRPISYWNVLDATRLTHLDPNDPGIILTAGQTLEANIETTISGSRNIYMFVHGGDF